MEDYENQQYNWPRFYRLLCQKGPDLLLGVNDYALEIIKMSASSTDMFWSEGLVDTLAQGAADGDLRAGVLSALELWRENVLDELSSNYGIFLDWEQVAIDDASPLIEQLVEAALPSQ